MYLQINTIITSEEKVNSLKKGKLNTAIMKAIVEVVEDFDVKCNVEFQSKEKYSSKKKNNDEL